MKNKKYITNKNVKKNKKLIHFPHMLVVGIVAVTVLLSSISISQGRGSAATQSQEDISVTGTSSDCTSPLSDNGYLWYSYNDGDSVPVSITNNTDSTLSVAEITDISSASVSSTNPAHTTVTLAQGQTMNVTLTASAGFVAGGSSCDLFPPNTVADTSYLVTEIFTFAKATLSCSVSGSSWNITSVSQYTDATFSINGNQGDGIKTPTLTLNDILDPQTISGTLNAMAYQETFTFTNGDGTVLATTTCPAVNGDKTGGTGATSSSGSAHQTVSAVTTPTDSTKAVSNSKTPISKVVKKATPKKSVGTSTVKKNNSETVYILVSVGVILLGVLGYYLYVDLVKNKKSANKSSKSVNSKNSIVKKTKSKSKFKN